MDQNVLVKAARELRGLLAAEGLRPRALLSVETGEDGASRLWIVPHTSLSGDGNKFDFYRRMASVVAAHRDRLSGLDVSDLELVQEDHPAIRGLRSMFKISGDSVITLSKNMLNGFYLPDATIIQMDFDEVAAAA